MCIITRVFWYDTGTYPGTVPVDSLFKHTIPGTVLRWCDSTCYSATIAKAVIVYRERIQAYFTVTTGNEHRHSGKRPGTVR